MTLILPPLGSSYHSPYGKPNGLNLPSDFVSLKTMFHSVNQDFMLKTSVFSSKSRISVENQGCT